MRKALPKRKIEKISKDKLEEDYQKDNFVLELEIDINKAICAMCKGDHALGLKMLKEFHVESEIDDEDDNEASMYLRLTHEEACVIDSSGVWASRHPLAGSSKPYFHYYCALFSPQTWFDGLTWSNLSKELYRSRGLPCTICKLKGASLGCHEPKCHFVAHIPCAMKANFRPNQVANSIQFFCENHHKQRKIAQKIRDDAVSGDISKGRELIEVSSEVPNLVEFEYTKENLDSDTVIASIQMVDDVMCCDCDDLCNDVNICSCLKLQRNYTNNGTLIAAKGRTIVECNLRCSCSVRRCTNRVVGKGLKYPLKVVQMHRRQISVARSEMQLCGDCSTVASTSNKIQAAAPGPIASFSATSVCIRSQEDIPAGAFICELTGQFVLGDSSVFWGARRGPDSAADATQSSGPAKPQTSWEVVDTTLGDSSERHLLVPVAKWEQAMSLDTKVWAERVQQAQQARSESEPLSAGSVATSSSGASGSDDEMTSTDAASQESVTVGMELPNDLPVVDPSHLNRTSSNSIGSIKSSCSGSSGSSSTSSKSSNSTSSKSSNSTSSNSTTTSSKKSNSSNGINIRGSRANSSRAQKTLPGHSGLHTMSTGSASVREFLEQQLYVDARYFGNIGRFLVPTDALVSSSIVTSSLPGDPLELSSSSSSSSAAAAAPSSSSSSKQAASGSSLSPLRSQHGTEGTRDGTEGTEGGLDLFDLRLVYTDHANLQYPRLAVFAAREIKAGTPLHF